MKTLHKLKSLKRSLLKEEKDTKEYLYELLKNDNLVEKLLFYTEKLICLRVKHSVVKETIEEIKKGDINGTKKELKLKLNSDIEESIRDGYDRHSILIQRSSIKIVIEILDILDVITLPKV